MPTSSEQGKDATLHWFKENQGVITRILDIGAGSGTYIKLIKEENNVCSTAEWVGVEVWKPYIEKYNLLSRYDRIINEDARTIDWSTQGKFTVALAGDILEHMTKDEAIKLVDELMEITDILLISIPIVHWPQDEYDNNPYEVHVKPDWSHDEVMATWSHLIKAAYIQQYGHVGVYLCKK
jgi:predicted TPR repeat methyltransferase